MPWQKLLPSSSSHASHEGKGMYTYWGMQTWNVGVTWASVSNWCFNRPKICLKRKGSFLSRKQDKKNFSTGSTREKTSFGRCPPAILLHVAFCCSIFKCDFLLWWRHTDVRVGGSITDNRFYMLQTFTATCFHSYIRNHHQDNMAPKKNCYVNHLILL